MSYLWMVRAGRRGVLAEDFEAKGCVAIGWAPLGDLSSVETREEIKERVEAVWGDEWKQGKINGSAGMIARFVLEFEQGDYVLTYNKEKRKYPVGRIVSDYSFRSKPLPEHPHVREVDWLGEVNRDDLSVSTKNTLGAIQALFQV